jgi:lycopene beta-cyclase
VRFDYVIAGGGLQAGLLVLALRHRQPAATVAVVEQADKLGGNHTWSFHAADVPAGAWPVVEPLVGASWPAYRVRFPGHARVVRTAYHSILSDRFDAVVRAALADPGHALRLGVEVVSVTSTQVTLATGEVLAGRCVIDACGADPTAEACGWQTFLGLEVELATPWPDALPTVMDATVSQDDGYRFVYVLPLGPTRLLVEETYFADAPALNAGRLRTRVADYLAAAGATGWRVVREESGALPMPWSGSTPVADKPLRAGAAGGWFHPATGYSFPAALRLALAVAAVPPDRATEAAAALAGRLNWRLRFARVLNRLLFRAVRPADRWRLFRRLYRTLPDATLARFYALEFTAADAARVLIGRPPPLDPVRLFSRPEVLPCPPIRR